MNEVIATAPVRVCDLGGWTDTWFGSPGQVCHLAVGPGVTVAARRLPRGAGEPLVTLVAPSVGADLRFGFATVDGGTDWQRPTPTQHRLLELAVGSVLESAEVGPAEAFHIEISSGVPAGAALGTSASVLVALIAAMRTLVSGDPGGPASLAEAAHQVETERAKREAGVQDQWAAAMGGGGLLSIGPYPTVRHRRLSIDDDTISALGERLVTVVFGAHDSSAVHAEVINALVGCGGEAHERARAALRTLSTLASQGAASLEAGDLDGWASLLTDSTEVQGVLHPGLVGSAHRRAIEVGRSLGATGWKVNGAGGSGGSLTLLAGESSSGSLADALAAEDRGWTLLALRPAPGVDIAMP